MIEIVVSMNADQVKEYRNTHRNTSQEDVENLEASTYIANIIYDICNFQIFRRTAQCSDRVFTKITSSLNEKGFSTESSYKEGTIGGKSYFNFYICVM